MSYQSIPNLIAHEIQSAEGIHLSDRSRHHIERLVMQAVQKENVVLSNQVEYWRNKHFGKFWG